MTTVDPRTVDVLLAARDAIGPDTWTQGTEHRDAAGRFATHHQAVRSCAVGHIAIATRNLRAIPAGMDARVVLAEVVTDEFSLLPVGSGIQVGEWNDDPGRTWQDVWDALDAAATLAKEQAS